MRVNLDTIARTLVGKIGKLVFYRYRKSDVLLARAWVKPRLTANNTTMGSRSANLALCYKGTSEDYRNDLLKYATQLNLETMGNNCYYHPYNVFLKMMYAMKRVFTNIDLITITPEVIVLENLPVQTVKMAIENELLPEVKYIDELSHEIV